MENIELLVTMSQGHINLVNSPQYFLFRMDKPKINYVVPTKGGFEDTLKNLGLGYENFDDYFVDINPDWKGFDEFLKDGIKSELLDRYSQDITDEIHRIIEDNVNNAEIVYSRPS